jgi:hypothetical protein
VDVTMPKSEMATMTPMMGDHKDNNNKIQTMTVTLTTSSVTTTVLVSFG